MAKRKVKKSPKVEKVSKNHHSNLTLGAAAGCLLATAAAATIYAAKRKKSNGNNVIAFAKNCLECVEDTASHLIEKPHTNRKLLIGAVGGSLLGAGTLLYYLTKENHVPGNFLKGAAKSAKWLEITKLVGDALTKRITHCKEHYLEELEEDRETILNGVKEVVDWGIAGFNLWKEIKKRR